MSISTGMFKVAAVTTLVTALGAAGCSTPEDGEGETTSPFSLTVRVENATVEEVAGALATYIDEVDDTDHGLPANWQVAGAGNLEEGEAALGAALKLPGGDRVVEVCNHHYAEQAMSFGGHHGVALPCEIGVNQVGDDVEVVLLEPEAIFGIFFNDIPAEYAAGMSGLAATVKGELEQLIVAGLAELDTSYVGEAVGPSWSKDEMAEFAGMDHAIAMDLEIPTSYLADQESRQTFKSLFVDSLLETLTHEDMEKVGSEVEGLSVADWRAARPYALGLPGQVDVVEMCSPTYAEAAMSTGAHHAPALPCQTAIWVEGDTLRVHLLDPLFIFPVFFSDAPAEMMEAMGGMASAVRQDIQMIVGAAQSTALQH